VARSVSSRETLRVLERSASPVIFGRSPGAMRTRCCACRRA